MRKKKKPGSAAGEFVRKTLKHYSVAGYLEKKKFNVKGEIKSG